MDTSRHARVNDEYYKNAPLTAWLCDFCDPDRVHSYADCIGRHSVWAFAYLLLTQESSFT